MEARFPWAVAGNIAVGVTLLACALALGRLHGFALAWTEPRAMQAWAAAAVVMAYVIVFAWFVRPRRARASAATSAGDDAITIAYASQTGFAQMLTDRSAETLRAAHLHVRTCPIDALTAADLLRGRMLFIASTTGEGDPPDHALVFVRRVMSHDVDLHGLNYAVLALGDREYEDFCGFGKQLDAWLRQHGARPLFDRVDVDNAEESALRHWQHHLGQLGGVTDLPDWDAPRYDVWRLAERTLMNPGSVGAPAYHIALNAEPAAVSTWTAGDIAEIGPRNSPATVHAFMRACGWDPAQIIEQDGVAQPLNDVLAALYLPEVERARAAAPAQIIATLPRLPHREYSIASIPQDGRLDLLVRVMPRADGSPGLGSGWLCVHAAVGGRIDVRIRRNSNFHPPADDVPMILIGNGTGIAGLRAHLKQRARNGAGSNWLIFGERNRERDYFHREEIERWQHDGVLSRIDLAFSRDTPARTYVQDVVRAGGEEITRWVERGAAIYVCGSLEGMAPGVDAALLEVLGEATLDALRESGRYRRDVY